VRLDVEAEIAEIFMAIRIAERNIFKRHVRPRLTSGAAPERRAARADEQPSPRFGQRAMCWVTSDERNGEIRGGCRTERPRRADQDDLAGGCRAALPQHDRPRQTARLSE